MRKIDKDIVFVPLRHKECEEIRFRILQRPRRSTWDCGVTETAIELLQMFDENWGKKLKDIRTRDTFRTAMLNGTKDWNQYSYYGCALIYDYDIAERYCSPSEFKKTRGGERAPNSHETWLDVQARALSQAAWMILNTADAAGLFKKEEEGHD